MVPRPASWTASRKFGIVIDAGSSGSRVNVYSWLDPEVAIQLRTTAKESLEVLSKVEKGVEEGDGWHFKVEPGISAYHGKPDDLPNYLKPLLDFAASVIPTAQHRTTPIYLLATAGMRLLPPASQSTLLATACSTIQTYNFDIPACESNVRIITGEEEGLYGWIAVNYLMDGFDSHAHNPGEKEKPSSTFGFLDMGGASTQIAFEPSEAERLKHADNLLEVKLRLLNGRDVRHPVFVTTWLGFGTNQARDRYIDQEIRTHLRATDRVHAESDEDATVGSSLEEVLIDDPCLPSNLMLSDPRHAGVTLRGTGDFLQCVRRTGPLLNKEVKCLDEPCLFNGVHVPAIDFNVNHFIGISEYWYSTQDVWKAGVGGSERGVYDFVEFEKNAIAYCSRDWQAIMKDHKEGKGEWAVNSVELNRLETQCFKAAWVVNILHEGIGVPRLIDEGGKGDGKDIMKEVVMKAGEKKLGDGDVNFKKGKKRPPSFQSLKAVGDVAISWTLGKMVLEVSRQAPGITSSGKVDTWQPTSLSNHADPFSTHDWGHIPSFRGDFRTTISGMKDEPALPLLAFVVFAVMAWFFCFGGKRRKSWRRRSGSDYGLVRDEEAGSGSDSSAGSGSWGGVKKRSSGTFARLTRPLRWAAGSLSDGLRSWSSSSAGRAGGGSSSLLPTSATSPVRLPTSTFSPAAEDLFKPRTIRQAKSNPFLRPSSTPTTLPTTSSSSTTHWNDAPDLGTAGLTVGGSSYMSERDRSSIIRSHSSSILSSASRSTSPPLISAIPPTPTSRPTTPARAGPGPATTLTKLARARDDDASSVATGTLTPPHNGSLVWEGGGGVDGTRSPSGAEGVKVRSNKSAPSLPGYFGKRS
ncbi:golgi apyrase [Pseudohyphozyma bogoriensis]|nr:golgi apyrase [Pseudohyphozyma bogoriensis]